VSDRRAGHGLAGLAERARLVHGTLESGALAGGGYRLAVTVPVSHA
jgi:signal transduction histidine kinase